jgi:hypothetical protein
LLVPVIAQLFVFLGTEPRIAAGLRNAILRVLRPAESAVRRLIVMAARGLVAKAVEPRPMPKGRIIAKGGASRPPSFQLFDPRKSFIRIRRPRKVARIEPRIRVFSYDPRIPILWQKPAPQPLPEPAKPVDDGLIDATRLSRRLEALKLALDDIPKQAKRLVRWQARRSRPDVYPPKFSVPLRPGRPPGYRAKPSHDIDDILSECHDLALIAQKPDTS